jgi:amidase
MEAANVAFCLANQPRRHCPLRIVASSGAGCAGKSPLRHLAARQRHRRDFGYASRVIDPPRGCPDDARSDRAMADAAVPDPLTATLADLRAALDDGRLTARDLARAALDRIAARDREGPALRAVIATDPDALAAAARLDAEWAAGARRGPLHGIPVLVKDNIATTAMDTTAGSLALAGTRPRRDAFVVERLREAGAVILGKTNLSEWSNFRGTRSTSGWSGVGGQTRNPHQLDRNPSGSSSGSAVAVAAGYVPVALGTETDGSIVSPANASGIVGIKPTVGLTSRMGVVPISHHQDTVGPFARTVADAALALTAIAVPDPDDPAVRAQRQMVAGMPGYPARPEGADGIDYASPEILTVDGLQGARLGVWRPASLAGGIVDAVFTGSLAALRAGGAELVEGIDLEAGAVPDDQRDGVNVLLWEVGPGIAAWIDAYAGPEGQIRTLADVIAFNRRHAAEELRWFGQDLLERAAATTSLDDPVYLATAVRAQRRGREAIDTALATHRLDAIVAPSGPPATRLDPVNGDHRIGGTTGPSARAGYPIVTVPAGERFGLPLNLSFIGGAFAEPELIRLAYAFEQATRARIAPAFAAPGLAPPHD